MNLDISKKAARRKRQRLRVKEKKALEKSQKENQQSQSESKQQAEEAMDKIPEKSKEQILAERQAKKAAKPTKSKDTAPAPPAGQSQSEGKQLAEEAMDKIPEKSKEQILAERQAKKAAKPAKSKDTVPAPPASDKLEIHENTKSKEQILAERQAKKAAKQTKSKDTVPAPPASDKLEIHENTNDADKAKIATKAERRAIQESQRAAKAKALEEKNKKVIVKKPSEVRVDKPRESMHDPPKAAVTKSGSASVPKPSALHKVKLFKHLYTEKCDTNINVNHHLHPAILKLGLQYSSDSIVGSNARCYAFLNAMKTLIADYVTPAEKIFSRGLEAEIQPAIEFLQSCRPLAVSMTNALKYIKVLISLEKSTESDEDKKQRLIDKIDTYASEQIETAAIAISLKVREKISSGDVILTYGCSSLIKRTLVEAFRDSEIKFRVIVVDSRPDHEGQEMLKSLAMLGINCTYVLINSISFIMPEVTKVLLGAHALLANGYVMSRVGTAQIALVANSYNVPVLVCCETHKFSERVQTDAFVFNELGDPGALIMNKNSRECSDHLKDWESIPHLTPLNLRYDVTPPELVTAVVTEVAILPCTSVQVILRVKPAE